MNNSKKILVIGAGLAQADAISKARCLGYYVMASDGATDAVGLKCANESRVIDVRDVEANLEWARSEKIDGVISYASDITLATVAAIREQMGLPGLGRLPMEISLDKSRQRELLTASGLPQPRYSVVENHNDYVEAISTLGFPVIVKPADNSGSRGVSYVCNMECAGSAFETAYALSRLGKVMVEEYIDGVELTVEGLSISGRHHVLAISDKVKPEGNYCVATQLAYPADVSDEMEQRVIEIITSAYDAIGVDNTPTHSEIIVSKEGPKIIELGCRGGGFYVFTRAVEAASGYPIVENWTRMCVGDKVDEVVRRRNGVVLRFIAAEPGRLLDYKGMEEAAAVEGAEIGLFIKRGDVIPKLTNDGSRTGWLLARAADRQQALAKAEYVSNLIEFTVGAE